jgi:hypothetical protein
VDFSDKEARYEACCVFRNFRFSSGRDGSRSKQTFGA